MTPGRGLRVAVLGGVPPVLGGGAPRLRAYSDGSGSAFHTGTPAMVRSPPKLLCTSTPTV